LLAPATGFIVSVFNRQGQQCLMRKFCGCYGRGLMVEGFAEQEIAWGFYSRKIVQCCSMSGLVCGFGQKA